jgi:lysophospholipase L1-like esterase
VRASIREYAGRLALVVGSLLACLVLIELALQLGALVQRATGREMQTSWLSGDRRILCLGDSNTYGIYLEPGEAYPAQLEALWNGAGGSRVEVLNLGFPGTDSSKLVSELPRLIDTLEPDLVTVLVGANDFWTEPVATSGRSETRPGAWRLLLGHSRLHRLFQLLRRRLDPVELEIQFESEDSLDRGTGSARFGDVEIPLGWRRSSEPPDDWLSRTRVEIALGRNLRELARQSHELDAQLVLLTYPSRFGLYAFANPVIQRVARATGTPFVDLADVFTPLCPVEECAGLLFPDHHPRARGHYLIAETLLRRLRADEGPGQVR